MTAQAPCKSRPGARGGRIHQTQKYGDAVRADHKVHTEENESRLQHRYAVVKTCVGVTTSQRQTDQKPTELPRMQPDKF